jgi:hypothetical protein
VNYEGNELFRLLYISRTERAGARTDGRTRAPPPAEEGLVWTVRSDYSLWSLSCTVPAIFSTVFGSSVVP